MKSSFMLAPLVAGFAVAQVENYGQCGGTNYNGDSTCNSGWTCQSWNPYYYQCIQTAAAAANPTASASKSACQAKNSTATNNLPAPSTMLTSPGVGGAGGAGVVTITTYVATQTVTDTVEAGPSGSSPAGASSAAGVGSSSAQVTASIPVVSSPVSAASSIAASSVAASSVAASSVAASSAPAASPSSTGNATIPVAGGKIQYAGVNIAGFDFGCGTDGTCTPSGAVPPTTVGPQQMTHFAGDGLNAFRLPVGWQYLMATPGGTIDSTALATYDTLVQGCISAGAEMCIIDIHNYARFNGAIIGQGGPTDAQFADLWSQIATKYATTPQVVFGVMNEPHDLPSVPIWANTVQAAVTAIRQAGATSQMILLPGNDYTSAATFVSDGSGPALMNVTNPGGDTDNLIFDVHRYLDSDNSGTHAECTTNNQEVFETLATYLRQNNRQAMLSETGGGPTDSTCLTNLCQQLQTLRDNSDVYLGWTGWAAGSFDTSYVLSETPNGDTDQPLVTQCIVGCFKGDCA